MAIEPGDYVSDARTVEMIRECQPWLILDGLIRIRPLGVLERRDFPILEYAAKDGDQRPKRGQPDRSSSFNRSEVRGSFAEMARRRR